MSSDLHKEMEALRRMSFGRDYDQIRRRLDRRGNEKRKKEFRELEDYFFHMVTYILSNQFEQGWWMSGHPLRNVITAHALRHLHKIGISLRACWNRKEPTDIEGNLFRAAKLLINDFGPKTTHSKCGTDVWDDCYVLLALFEVQSDLEDEKVQAWDGSLKEKLQDESNDTVNWLRKQFDGGGFTNVKVTGEDWFGPGFYAAAMELFAHPGAREKLPKTDDPVGELATAVGAMIEESFTVEPKWHNRFAWHAGQILVTWSEKRKSYPSLRTLDPIMNKLFEELKTRQSKNGAWDNNGQVNDFEYQVYYTVRGLAACYVNTNATKILESRHIELAHHFLLETFGKYQDGQLVDPKASINALGAFQKLFEFHVRDIFPTSLLSLTARTNKLGLLDHILKPLASDSETLKGIRKTARQQLEKRGENGLELLGINCQLYDALKGNSDFLREFTGDRSTRTLDKARTEILGDLRRCLSATLTETRSKFSHRLIMKLWDTDGFLNFKPLIEHLSVLEQDRAFYKYYRDHLNHELLLFLLGAYIYYNCATFKDKINNEMLTIYDQKSIKIASQKLPGEFLFRWKLISTFHDIGYLFEVDPFKDKSNATVRSKTELIEKSWQVVDGFRKEFLYDYFLQTIEPSNHSGLDARKAETANEQEVKELAETMTNCLKPYPGGIKGEAELLKLFTAGKNDDPFKLVSQYVKPGHIGPNLIKNYFYLCGALPVEELKDGLLEKQRDPYYDHGIMSALILLKATDIQRHYLNELRNEEFIGTLQDNFPKLADILKGKTKEHLNPEQFFIRFSHVAGAIALHNIGPTLYRQEQCAEFDKSDKRSGESVEKTFYPDSSDGSGGYSISLEENPLSYLTALADTLQDWDRHSFRRLSFTQDSDPLTASELNIDFEDDKIHVRRLTTAAIDKYDKLAGPKSMGHLMNWSDYLKLTDKTTPGAKL